MLLGRRAMENRFRGRPGRFLCQRPPKPRKLYGLTDNPRMEIVHENRPALAQSTPVFVPPHHRGRRGARSRNRRHRRAALLHEHRLAQTDDSLQGRRAGVRIRRGDSAHRRVGDQLRHRGAAAVRNDGRGAAQRIGGDHPLARQAALAAAAVAARHRHAADRLRQQTRRHQGHDQDGRRRAAGDQAAARAPRASAWCWPKPRRRPRA